MRTSTVMGAYAWKEQRQEREAGAEAGGRGRSIGQGQVQGHIGGADSSRFPQQPYPCQPACLPARPARPPTLSRPVVVGGWSIGPNEPQLSRPPHSTPHSTGTPSQP